MEARSKAFLLFFLFSDWLSSNHLRSWIERGFLDTFSRHICSAITETIRVTNNATSFGAKNIQKTKFEAAEMILDPWNQQVYTFRFMEFWPPLLEQKIKLVLISFTKCKKKQSLKVHWGNPNSKMFSRSDFRVTYVSTEIVEKHNKDLFMTHLISISEKFTKHR